MKFLLLLPLSLLSACTSGNCRSLKTPTADEKILNSTLPEATNIVNRVKVFKYDGSLQCGMGKAIPLSEMQKDLAGLQVYSAENKADGLMHIQACGTPTGRANVYEIEKSQLEEAKKRSFREWTFE